MRARLTRKITSKDVLRIKIDALLDKEEGFFDASCVPTSGVRMCNEKGDAVVVLTVIARKGVGAHVAIMSAQYVEKNCKNNLLAYSRRMGINIDKGWRGRSAAYCYHVGRLGQRTFPDGKGEENRRDGRIQ